MRYILFIGRKKNRFNWFLFSVNHGLSQNEFLEEGKGVRKRKNQQSLQKSVQKNVEDQLQKMDAGNVEKETDKLKDFVGIFDLKMLPSLKLVAYPCSLIVLTDQHWIGIFISNKTIEIMDSMGYLSDKNFSKSLRVFLSAHLLSKSLVTTPKIQADDSNLCALYAVCFLYFRTLSCGNLCDFCRLFTSNLSENCYIITKLYTNLRKMNKLRN